jgi:hypothetical protein
MESHSIAIHVNGTRIVADVEPRVLLVHFLREQAGLTGTHIGCDTSQCVRLDGATVKSCTVLAVQADGHAVTTIEGLADPARLTPLRQAFHERHELLSDDGEGTPMRYEARAEVGRKLAQLGGRLIDSAAKKLADQFFEKFAAVVGEPPA